jgi:siroheme synthase
MGLRNLGEIAAHLVALSKSADTPVAVIQWGTYQTQQTIVGTLASIAGDVERAGVCAPAVVVIGEVVRLRESLNWFWEEPRERSNRENALVAA